MSNKFVLITGGAQRIGAALVEAFASKNFNVLFTYNSSHAAAENLKNRISKRVKCDAFCVDLTKENSAEDVMKWAFNHTNNIECFVNNASIMIDSPIANIDWDQLHEQFSLHLYQPLLFARELKKNQGNAHIVNIGDAKYVTNKFKRAAYLLSKKSLIDMTKMAALELAPHIRVNAIAPGWVLDPIGKESRSKDTHDAYLNRIPLRKKTELNHVIDAIFFLHSMKVMTGQVLFLDGGTNLI